MILALGEALVELNQAREDPTRYLQSFGGDTSNFCVAAARSGARAGYLSAVGDDRFGRMLRALWQREGVDDGHVRTDPAAPTGVYFVTHDADGHHFEYRRAGSAASRYRPEDLPREAVAAARVLHVSGVTLAIGAGPRAAALEAMAIARAAGAIVSLDTNLRLALWPLAQAREALGAALRLATLCLPSLDEIRVLWEIDDRDAIADKMLDEGARIVALKMAAEGCYVATPERRALVPPHPVEARDATGAGDCFGGTFAARLVAGDDPFRAARYANVAAALSTRGYGAVDPIPLAAEVMAALS